MKTNYQIGDKVIYRMLNDDMYYFQFKKKYDDLKCKVIDKDDEHYLLLVTDENNLAMNSLRLWIDSEEEMMVFPADYGIGKLKKMRNL